MCIVQRYCIIALAIFSTFAVFKQRWALYPALAFSAIGAFTAARQSVLQWNPPEFMSCGRDFYGMVEAFSLSKLIPSVFAGSGDCASSAENLFGVTLANASFVFFAAAVAAMGLVLWTRKLRS
jgi:disulfide bond formation protein DsbB